MLEKWKSLTGKERTQLVEKAVSDVLERFPYARNSDLYLTILVLRYYTKLGKYISMIPLSVIMEYDGILEAIRRTRQRFNEKGMYLPTDPNVLERRMRKARKMRKALSKE